MSNSESAKFSAEQEQMARAVIAELKTQVTITRDPADVTALTQKNWLLLIFGLSLVAACALCFVMFLRKPTLITAVVTPDGRQVTSINDREFGCGTPVELGKDNLTSEDKEWRANQIAEWLYAVYLPSRDRDIERALLAIKNDKFLKEYSAQLTSGQLQTERSERWNATWTKQRFSVDSNNPMIVRLLGKQDLTKLVNNEIKRYEVQLEITFELTTDGGRSDANFRTGFDVLHFKTEEISRSEIAA